MRCDECREALSARLDGEESAADRVPVDLHLDHCDACRQWFDDAVAVNRIARMGAVTATPQVDDRVLAAAPGPARRRLSEGLRIALGVVGSAQLLLGLAQLSGSAAVHEHGLTGATHLWNESAAWNVAIGAGFGWIAVRRARPAAMIPMLTAFVGLLALLSIGDLTAGRVDATRLLSHALIVIGYVIVLLLTRPSLDFGEPPETRLPHQWQAHFDAAEDPNPPRPALSPTPLYPAPPRPVPPRSVPQRSVPPQTARHGRAA